jgi:hypothetical protein
VNPWGSHEGHDHDDEHRDHEHGFELAEVLRVVFVALAAIVVYLPSHVPVLA